MKQPTTDGVRYVLAWTQAIFFTLLFSNMAWIPYVHAGPQGGTVTGGSGSISQSGNQTTINQNSQNMAIDWQSYNLGIDERVQYIQPNSSSISLNRILSNSGSVIQGRIDANGQVILINPNGIFFTSTAVINVGGIVASGLDMTPTDFMNGNYIFNEVLGTEGKVVNSGLIKASTGGNVTLLGKQVKNDGLIIAKLGSVNLAAGKEAVLTFDKDGLIGIGISKAILQDELGIDPAVLNSGTINAEGGRVLLTASVSRDIFSEVIKVDEIRATSVVVNEDGTFTLGGGADVENTGSIDVSTNGDSANDPNVRRIVLIGENVTSSGTLRADNVNGNGGEIELHARDTTLLTENSITSARSEANGQGGIIKVLGDKVGLLGQSIVDASGANGGGTALLGGDYRGENQFIRNASGTYIGKDTLIAADSLGEGNGGRVIVWGNDSAKFYGAINARGGQNGGDGGFVETSAGYVELGGLVDVSSPLGLAGTWLIDPYNITIQNGGIEAIDETNPGPPDTLFTANAYESILLISTLQAALNNGETVVIETAIPTGDTQPGGGDITLADTLNVNGLIDGTATLILNAHNNININATLRDSGNNNDKLNIELNANTDRDTTYGGDVNINAYVDTEGGTFTATGDAININASGLVITQGGSFTSNSSTFTNNGTINTTGSTNRNGGDIDITASGVISSTQIIYANGGAANRFGGDGVAGRDGGDVSIVTTGSTGTITLAGIETKGSTGDYDNNNGGENGGNGGVVTLIAQNSNITLSGEINTSGGNGDGDDQGGDNNDPASGGNAGNINITGNIVSLNTITANGGTGVGSTGTPTGGNGGQINIGGTTINLNGSISSRGGNLTDGNGNGGNGNNMTITANTGGVITIAAGRTIDTRGGTGNNNGTDGDFTANSVTNAIGVTFTGYTSSINVGDGNVLFEDLMGTVRLGSIQAGTLTTANVGAIRQPRGTIQISGLSSLASNSTITLNNDNDFNQVNIDAVTASINDTNGIIIGDISLTGLGTALNIVADGNIVQADNSTISSTGTGSIIRLEATGTGNISQGTGARIINDTVGAVTNLFAVDNTISLGNVNNDFNQVNVNGNTLSVVLRDTDDIMLGGMTITGINAVTLDVTAGGTIGQAGAIINDGTGAISRFSATGQTVTLEQTNDFTSVEMTAGAVSVIDIDDIDLGASNVTADYSVTSGVVNGITQSAGLTVGGQATFTLVGGADSDITLGNTDNDFNNISIVASVGTINDVTVTDTNGLALDALTLTGDLIINANEGGGSGNVTDNGAISVAGATTINAGTGNVVLDTVSNNFNRIDVAAANVELVDADDIELGNISITGTTLQVTALGTGNITQATGTQIENGNGTTVLTADGNDITLENANNDFGTLSITQAAIASIVDSNDINLGTSNISSSLSITSGGDITNTGGAIILDDSATAAFTAGDNGSITLIDAGNRFAQLVSLSSSGSTLNNVAITNTVATQVNVGNRITNNLDVISGGSITSSSALVVNGTTTLSANGQDITLTNAANDFNIINVNAANSVDIRDTNAIEIGSINANTVNVNAGQIALGLVTASTTTLTARSGQITDNNGGAINITGDTATLNATNGVGAGDPLETQLANLTVTNTSGGIGINNSGNVTVNMTTSGDIDFTNTGDVYIDLMDGIANGDTHSHMQLTVLNGSVFGAEPQTLPDIRGHDVTVIVNDGAGDFGTAGRPIYLDVHGVFTLLANISAYDFYGDVPIDIVDNSSIKLSISSLFSLLSSQKLIEVESLLDLDPAIFTEVRNYYHDDLAIMMPLDQMYSEEEEEERRRTMSER